MIIVVRITVPDDTKVPQDTYELLNLLHGIDGGQVDGQVDSLYAE